MRRLILACALLLVPALASAQVITAPPPYVGATGAVAGSLTFPTGSALRTGTTSGDTLLLQAYDVDGGAYTSLLTLTAGNTPTLTAGAYGLAFANGGRIYDEAGTTAILANSDILALYNEAGSAYANVYARTLTLYGATATNLLWGSDGSGSIGSPTANRPNSLHLNRGTITDPAYAISTVANWNDSADTFTLWFANVTDGASAAASLLVDLQVGSASKFKVAKNGDITAQGGVTATTGNIAAASAGYLVISSRLRIGADSDGVATIYNLGQTALSAFNLGPTTGNTAGGVSAIKHVETDIDMATATGTGTGTITSPTTALPVGLIEAVTCTVKTSLTGAGLTTFSVGDGVDADRWGAGIAIAYNTKTSVSNFTVSAPAYQNAAGSIVLTAAAGVFSTGILHCTTAVKTYTPISN